MSNTYDISPAIRRRFENLLVFNVCNDASNWLEGLPCFGPNGDGGYLWTLPATFTDVEFSIGWEMGLAFLRSRQYPGGAVFPEQLDPAPLELSLAMEAMKRMPNHQGGRENNEGYRDGFLVCIGVLLDHAINAPRTLPALLARIEALDDADLRARCLTILDGKPVPDIFECEGLGWTS